MKQVLAAAVISLGIAASSYAADQATSSDLVPDIYILAQNQTKDPQSTQLNPDASLELIKQVQQQLKAAGIYEGEIDGKLTSETREAIEQFQDDKGLPLTGSLDPETIAALQKDNSNTPGSSRQR
jgi:peptidoglycan hydrolase-like protein with peptidoglycan-binding domain